MARYHRVQSVPVSPRIPKPREAATYLVLFLLALGLWSAQSTAQSLADTVDRLRPSVVAVGTAYPPRQPIGGKTPSQVRGSGFIVGDGLLVATNDHVLPEKLDTDNRQSLAVFAGRGSGAQVRNARIVLRDPDHDLALLRISGSPLPAVTVGSDSGVREGDSVAFTGYPIGAVLGLFPATHRAIVSAITPLARSADTARGLTALQRARLRDPFEVFQLDAIAYPGNSGSPVYRVDSGDVIGVINSVFVKESRESVLERPSGITFAIPARYLRALLVQYAAQSP